ncbi:adenosylmethionine--8-amino-7-oxononanoate transaminase [Rickettsiales endosymbiont of Peranema trichophorum]|uniref:adenosylmethionine--8-amino-7-oxononanoate transaminase n=1 Tax=Rickettsiales endosymbiont of Peranema trichophorum TaxID=2486577 RepID=UPI001022D8EB|nr:adenosylmethionine--8-amino-7-oxononanoate transaminase [Rickettsiales endosymbiont of Peranema trichophorum]RZI47573.1 adenosylmethionine--8-amino-7-oxononanoate transaminase [Rickettsiales endosymbiont of Peranema trichophorum]
MKKTLIERDKSLIWHPFSNTLDDITVIKRGEGAYLYDESDRRYVDLISSWWVNIHGHGNKTIANKIYEQALALEHVVFAGFTHEPAIELCDGLKQILPTQYSKFFFSDNGSTALEVSLKMAYQYWSNRGEPNRTLFLSFDGGYHGDTFGGMSIGVKSGFHDTFSSFLFKVLTIPYPATWTGDDEVESKEQNALSVLDSHLMNHGTEIAAIVLEPLIQGASGMRICRAQFINEVVKRLHQQNILVIFDEVMTGFGRTGTDFAMSQLSVEPDFLCIAKGLTGGFLPLSLTVTNDKIFDLVVSSNAHYAFPHGHSYTANPIACAAAIASLELFKSSRTQEALIAINEAHHHGIQTLVDRCHNICNTRILGTIGAFEITTLQHSTAELRKIFLKEGLILRPLGHTVYILPPYCIDPNELKKVYHQLSNILNAL